MPTVDIPGVGIVEFPYDMSDADIAAAAKRIHAGANQRTETSEANAPAPKRFSMIDSLTGRDGGPSTRGFIEGLGSQAVDAVKSLPRTIRGLTKINPSELPGQIAEGISERVQSYANDPLATVYDDPLGFIGDVASVTGIGAAASAPVRAGATQTARAASRAAAASSGLAGKVAPVVVDAAIDALPGGRLVRGAVRTAAGALRRAPKAADDIAETARAATPEAKLVEAMAEGYDRYMPNTSAAKLPGEFSTDMPPPQRATSLRDDQVTAYISKSPEYQELMDELMRSRSMRPAPRGVTRTGASILTPEELQMVSSLAR